MEECEPLQKRFKPSEEVLFNVNLIYANICPYLSLPERATLSTVNRRTYELLGKLDTSVSSMRLIHTRRTRMGQLILLAEEAPLECIFHLLRGFRLTLMSKFEDACVMAAAQVGRMEVIRAVYEASSVDARQRRYQSAIIALLHFGHFGFAQELFSSLPSVSLMSERTLWRKSVFVGAHEFEQLLCQKYPHLRVSRYMRALKLSVARANVAEVEYWAPKCNRVECANFFVHVLRNMKGLIETALLDEHIAQLVMTGLSHAVEDIPGIRRPTAKSLPD